MCGLFGFNRSTQKTREMTGVLALYMNERGRDSWGVTDGEFIGKHVGSVVDGFQEYMLDGPIYHCRAASCGAVSERNAHPFAVESAETGQRVVGIHNGHISNHYDLKQKYSRQACEVDSEQIFHHLAEHRDLGEIGGWGAVAWYEYPINKPAKKILYLSKFGSMDNLHVAKLEDGVLVFASTSTAIEKACRFAGVKIKSFYKIQEHKLYAMDGDKLVVCGDLLWGSHPFSAPHRAYVATSKSKYTSKMCLLHPCSKDVTGENVICDGCFASLKQEWFGVEVQAS